MKVGEGQVSEGFIQLLDTLCWQYDGAVSSKNIKKSTNAEKEEVTDTFDSLFARGKRGRTRSGGNAKEKEKRKCSQ